MEQEKITSLRHILSTKRGEVFLNNISMMKAGKVMKQKRLSIMNNTIIHGIIFFRLVITSLIKILNEITQSANLIFRFDERKERIKNKESYMFVWGGFFF